MTDSTRFKMNKTLIKRIFTEAQGGLSEPTNNRRYLQEAFSTAQSKGRRGESSVIGALLTRTMKEAPSVRECEGTEEDGQ